MSTITTAPTRTPRAAQPLSVVDSDGLLQIKTVCTYVGLSASQVYALAAEGQFPKPIRLSPKCARWPAAAVRGWVQSKIAAQGAAA